MPIDYVAVGHFTHDVTPHGPIIGGAAAYSSITMRNLGLQACVVTSVGADFQINHPLLHDIQISSRISEHTTTFHNLYEGGRRQQYLLGVAEKIIAEHIPPLWRDASIAYLCPVANEVDVSVVSCFPKALIGVTPQGWMRRWDETGRVSPKRWDTADQILPHTDVLILSEEDIAAFPDELDRYIALTKLVVVTQGKQGATLYEQGRKFESQAYPANEMDATGAGDVFAAAFLIKYHQTLDSLQALDFAHCVASFAVEAEGTMGIPTIDAVMQRLRRESEIRNLSPL